MRRMSRVLFHPVVVVPLAAGGGWLAYRQVRDARAASLLPPLHPAHVRAASKLSMYDNDDTEEKSGSSNGSGSSSGNGSSSVMYVEDPPSVLAEPLAKTRQALSSLGEQLEVVHRHVSTAESYVTDVQSGKRRILADSEQFLPDAFYVLVSGFAGTLFARNRGRILRGMSFVLFSGIAFAIFYPQSSSRIVNGADAALEKYAGVSARSSMQRGKKAAAASATDYWTRVSHSWMDVTGFLFSTSTEPVEIILTEEPKKSSFGDMYSTRSSDIGLDGDVSGSESKPASTNEPPAASSSTPTASA